MTKKFLLILLGVFLAVGVLGAAGYAYAQVGDNPEAETADDSSDDVQPGFLGWRSGHWFGFGGEGILDDYVFDEMAKAFDLSDEAIAAFQKVRETILGIKDEYSADEIRTMTKEAMTAAIDSALADEVITQDQADRMLERLDQAGERGFGRFGGRGSRGRFPGMMMDRGNDGMLGQYMEAALADALGLSVEEFQALKADEGFNVADYAVEQDMTVEELQEWMQGVYTAAINAALEDGAITQDQADRMLENLENFEGRMPFGPGFSGRGPGW